MTMKIFKFITSHDLLAETMCMESLGVGPVEILDVKSCVEILGFKFYLKSWMEILDFKISPEVMNGNLDFKFYLKSCVEILDSRLDMFIFVL